MFVFLLFSTLLTRLIGAPMYLFIESSFIYAELILALTGIAIIFFISVIQKKFNFETVNKREINFSDGVILVIVQGFSAISGLSKSGLTTLALLFKGFTGEQTFKLLFLMSIPVSFGASIGSMILNQVLSLTRWCW